MFVVKIADDPNSFLGQHEFDNIETEESSKSVLVSDRYTRDAFLQRSLKNRSKAFSVPVESASDIGDDLPARVFCSHVLDLLFEVIFLPAL